MGIPTTIQGACGTILAGNTRTVDMARCNGRPMILLAGVGFEADYVNRANRELKNRFGVLAYILAGVQQLNEADTFEATLELEGAEHSPEHILKGSVTTSAITIANAAPATSVLAQGFGEVRYTDGLLDITISTVKTRMQAITAITSLFASALVSSPTNREDILCLRGSRVKITTNQPRHVVMDGEIIGTTPVEVECIPRGLTLLTPLAKEQSWWISG
jgi:diacylglycerol kinase family enzyme